jgi:hypothetical protein
MKIRTNTDDRFLVVDHNGHSWDCLTTLRVRAILRTSPDPSRCSVYHPDHDDDPVSGQDWLQDNPAPRFCVTLPRTCGMSQGLGWLLRYAWVLVALVLIGTAVVLAASSMSFNLTTSAYLPQ